MKRRTLTKRQKAIQLASRKRRLMIETLEQRAMLAAQPIITEFMASNNDTLLDGNGNSSDWIELFNVGDMTVDLEGWYLTDDATDLTKWQFPDHSESVLDPGEYLVVFASGNGAVDPAGNLHTNFGLSASGEYVALVMPDQSTIASEFGPNGTDYPEQFTDVSYGFVGSPLADESPIQYFDSDEAPGGNTTGLFGGWAPRGAGAGADPNNFGNEGGTLQATGPVSEIATTITGLDANAEYEAFAFFWDVGGSWNVEAGLVSGQLQDFFPGSPGVFPIDASTQVAGSDQLVVGLNVLGEGSDTYDDWIDGNRTLYAAPLGLVAGSSSHTIYIDHNEANSGRTFFDGVGFRETGSLLSGSSPAHYLVPSDDSLGTSWTANGFDAAANGFTSGFATIGYELDEVDNDDSFIPVLLPDQLNPELPFGTRSAYMITTFELGDASSISSLTLSMKYDDGFVAYLNGTPVVSQFAPGNLTFNSTATTPTNRTDADSLQFDDFSLASFTNLLVDGTNTLAFHALNSSPNSTDFLLSPKLTATVGTSTFSEIRYLTTPTPGSLNGIGVEGFVGDTNFSVDRGFFDAPFDVEITSSTPDAEIYYTLDGTEPNATNPSAILVNGPISITQTTSLRAAAFKDGFEPTDVDTQTYIFIEDVVVQDPYNIHGNGTVPNNGLTYPTTLQQGFTPQFDMDPEIVTATEYDDSNGLNTDIGIRESLLALPTVSLTLPHDEFFGPLGSSPVGIATDATQRVERSGSIEYFDPNTGETFQFNAEIEAHGNSSRNNSSTPKHSFRVTFNRTGGGPSALRIPIFENSDNDDIDVVVMRGIFTEAFAARNRNNITNRFNPLYSTYIRDSFLRDTQIETGNLSPASTYAHLYINGLYWGLYNPTERIDDNFLESNLGGNAEDYDIVRGFNGELFRGSRTAYNELLSTVNSIDSLISTDLPQANLLYQQLQGNFADGTNDPNLDALLDVNSLIDYLIIQQWSGAGDWPGGNWYAARNRVEPGKGFQFIIWDQELSLDQLFRDRTGTISGNDTPGELYNNLKDLPEFQLRYADRAYKLLANDGPLSPSVSQARWDKWANLVEPAIVAESARWGDAQEGIVGDVAFSQSGPAGTTPLIPVGQRATVDDPLTIQDWRTNVAHVRDEVLAKSADILLDRLLSRQLFTSVDPPVYSIDGSPQHGGSISVGSSLTMAAAGPIYYTLDGSDPRDATGGIAGTLYSGPIQLDTTTVVSARTFTGGVWSALSETTFTTDTVGIVLSEINYNPYLPTASELAAIPGLSSDDFEFVELYNANPTASINLNGYQLTVGVTFSVGNVTLAPGERAVIVEDAAAFEARYGTGINVLGEWSGRLSNSGENLTLLNGLGVELVSMDYGDSDPWAISSDGVGATLVLADAANTPANQLEKHYRFRGSAEYGGTPGAASAELAGIVINEVLAHTDLPEVDAIELHNPTDSAIDVGGWFVSDSDIDLLKYEIPGGTIIGAGQYLVLDEHELGFGLKADEGDEVYLVTSDGLGGVGSFVDQVSFGGSFNGQTFGRVPNGSGRFAPLMTNTLNGPNSAPQVGPLVISEVNYHPENPSQAALNIDPTLIDNDLEFVEVYNPTDTTFDLTDWRIRGRSDFDFATGTMLGASEAIVVVTFDVTDTTRVDAFRTHYGIGTEVTLVGGLDDNLSNGSARIELQQPDDPPLGNPTFVPHVTSDEVLYDDLEPWPTAADGGGQSLERVGPTLYGNDATNWLGAVPTPGTVDFTPLLPGDYNRDLLVDQQDYLVWKMAFGSTIAANSDGNSDGVVDAADYTIWRNNLGSALPTGAASNVVADDNSQEPAALNFGAFFASPDSGTSTQPSIATGAKSAGSTVSAAASLLLLGEEASPSQLAEDADYFAFAKKQEEFTSSEQLESVQDSALEILYDDF